MEKLLDVRAAAERLGGIAVRTLERWRVEQRGPAYVKIGGRVFYEEQALSEFIARGRRLAADGNEAA
jgi:hypothetical protein